MCSILGVIALQPTDPHQVLDYAELAGRRLQHRGHEWAGVAFSAGNFLRVEKKAGLASALLADPNVQATLANSAPQMVLMQTRFSTQGSSTKLNAQPHYIRSRQGTVALGSNGDTTHYEEERERLTKAGSLFISGNDSEVLLHHVMLKANDNRTRIPEGLTDLMQKIAASFSAWLATEDTVYLFRDVWGNRPLFYMKVGGYFVFASEDSALKVILAARANQGTRDGTVDINQVLPGEIIKITLHGQVEHLEGCEPRTPCAHCAFEKIYFARPNSQVFSTSADRRLCYQVVSRWLNDDTYVFDTIGDNTEEAGSFRFRLGEQLAREHPVKADCVISVPASGDFAALGFSHESGIPFQVGLVRDPYTSRTFISPGQKNRANMAAIKYDVMEGLFQARDRIVVVDDSLVYGTTSRRICTILKAAGAKEIHLRLSCPPILHACKYGIDMSSKGKLIATILDIDGIRQHLGISSIGYLSIEGLRVVLGERAENFCQACWTGDFPID